ncbi:MAG: hypothetical protein H0A76_12305 [Candidatus Thiodubiliella endoseptemdiera]|uniref:Uncharacterized protein n=1 Tax=Candidatus Thiodubiliella endoseptemdiera TaxID=2738886 RepID=A0A853F694_9GAMM|nr:hypothetical protein [Candidatus Thiodubiliella endoseptemdiera]
METAFEVLIALGLASLAKGSVDTDEDELIKSFISKTLDGIPIVSNLKSVVLYHGTSIPVVDFTLEGVEDVYKG